MIYFLDIFIMWLCAGLSVCVGRHLLSSNPIRYPLAGLILFYFSFAKIDKIIDRIEGDEANISDIQEAFTNLLLVVSLWLVIRISESLLVKLVLKNG